MTEIPETISSFVDHLVFRVASLDVTERFYSKVLGQVPERSEDSLMYWAGETRLFFSLPGEHLVSGGYDKENVGLNHMALRVSTLAGLQAMAERLKEARITHSGIVVDSYGSQEFIWLDDPDGMRLEFYLRPSDERNRRSALPGMQPEC